MSNTGHYQTDFPKVLWLPLPEVATAALEATVKGRAVVAPAPLQERRLGHGITPPWLRRVASGHVQRTWTVLSSGPGPIGRIRSHGVT